DEEVAKEDTPYVPFSLDSDEDGDRPEESKDGTSNFFSSSWQKKQKVQLSFAQQESSDSEELFPWLVEDKPKPKSKPKRSVQFTEPLFQVASPVNDEAGYSGTYESGSRAVSPSDNLWENVVDESATSPDKGNQQFGSDATDTYGDEIVQELRRNFEKHQSILAAKCVPDVNEPSQDWSGSDDCPMLISRDRPELFGTSPRHSPNFEL
ncbi:unnamed protein product, partial [Ixodes hexagonus]